MYCYVASVCDGLVAVTVYICALVNCHRCLQVLSIKGFPGGQRGHFAPLEIICVPLEIICALELDFNNELALS